LIIYYCFNCSIAALLETLYNGGVRKVLFIILAVIAVIGLVWYAPFDKSPGHVVTNDEVEETQSFEECVEEGNPVMESYPPTCRTKSGKTVTQNVGNGEVLHDKIRVESPQANQKIKSPLVVEGEARGVWYFEADFSAKLLNEDGEVIGQGIMTAEGEWMTEEFVPFKGEITFEKPKGEKGKLVLEKSNPSGLPEHAESLIVPVEFE
jgi:hypothetical protein